MKLVVAAVFASLAACSSSAPPPATPTPAPAAPAEQRQPDGTAETAPAATETAPPELAIGDFELLDTGAEPRRQLRYTLTTGTEMRRKVVIHTLSQMTEHDTPYRETDDIELVIRAEVGQALSDGSHWITFEIESAANLNDPSDPELANAVGVVFRERRSQRGERLEHGVDAAGGMVHSEAEEMFLKLRRLAMYVVFPAEALGVGARWRWIDAFEQIPGIELPRNNVYELVALEGDAATVRIDFDLHAANEPLFAADGPMGTSERIGELSTLDVRGGGQAVIELTAPIAETSQLNTTTDAEASFSNGAPGGHAEVHYELGARVVAP